MRMRSRTHQIILASLAIVSFQLGVARAQAQQDFSAELARAEILYRGGQFPESLILLTELEKRIGTDPRRTDDLVQVKLFMGLAHAALNQKDQAKSKFIEVCSLDSKYSLNPQDHQPEVVALYDEAKAGCASSARPAAPSALSIEESTFQGGKELYEKGQYTDALRYFNVVLALNSEHALAREYSELAQERLVLLADRGYTEWRSSFDARQFDKAAAAYNKIRDDPQLAALKLSDRIQSEYQKALSDLVDSWKAACAARTLTRLGPILNEATSVASGLPFGRDALAQLRPCPSAGTAQVAAGNPVKTPGPARPSRVVVTDRAPPANVASPPRGQAPAGQTPSSCIQGDPVLAMTRLKTRVNPKIDPSLQRYVGRGIVVRVHIDEEGNVEVNEVANANPRIAGPLRTAVEQWKFNPAVINDQVRCVETGLPIAVIQP
jgi:hypothetical protein